MALKQSFLNEGRETKVGEAMSTAMVPIADVRECKPLRMKICRLQHNSSAAGAGTCRARLNIITFSSHAFLNRIKWVIHSTSSSSRRERKAKSDTEHDIQNGINLLRWQYSCIVIYLVSALLRGIL